MEGKGCRGRGGGKGWREGVEGKGWREGVEGMGGGKGGGKGWREEKWRNECEEDLEWGEGEEMWGWLGKEREVEEGL